MSVLESHDVTFGPLVFEIQSPTFGPLVTALLLTLE